MRRSLDLNAEIKKKNQLFFIFIIEIINIMLIIVFDLSLFVKNVSPFAYWCWVPSMIIRNYSYKRLAKMVISWMVKAEGQIAKQWWSSTKTITCSTSGAMNHWIHWWIYLCSLCKESKHSYTVYQMRSAF